MSSLSEVDSLRSQVAELAHELAVRDQALRKQRHHLDGELRDLRDQSTQLQAIITGTAEKIGEDFFPAVVTQLTSVLGVQYAVIGEVRQDSVRKQISTVAVAAGGALVDNFEYDLLDTPCETALASSFACFERDVQASFPSFTRLRQLNVEGYCGVSIRAKGGAVIGVLVLMDSKPIGDGDWLRLLLTMLASRAAAELERTRAEQVFEHSARRYKDLVNSINGVVWEVDTSTTQFTFVSPQIEAMLGYPVEQWLSSSTFWVYHMHPEDRSWAPQYCYEETRKHCGHTFEYRMLAADGRIVWVRDVVSVLVEDGRATKLRGILEDITARKQAEEQLHESELRFRALAERIGDVFWISDPINRKLVYVSQTYADIWGRNPNDLYDHFETWLDGIHEDDRARVAKEFFGNILAGTYDTEYRIRRPDGSIRWIRDRGKPLSIGTLGAGVAEDITERKQAEENLKLFRALLDQVTDSIEVIEPSSGRFLDGNRQSYESIGYTRGEWSALTVSDIDPLVTKPVFQGYMRRLRKADAPLRIESLHIRKDGTTFPVEVVAQIFRHDREYLVAVARDISLRKQMEAELAEREERLRLFIEHSPVALAMFDQEMRYLTVSRRWRSMYGLDDRPLIGQSHYEVFPEIPERWKAIHRRCLAGAVERCEEDPFVRADGRTEWARWEIHPWLTADGSVGGIVLFAEDITIQVQARDMQRWLVAIVESSDDAILSKDIEGRVTSWNRGAERLFGYQAEEMIGQPITRLFPLDRLKEEKQILEQIQRGESIEHFETVRQTKDGRSLDISLTLSPMRDEHGRIVGVSKIARDITERKRAEGQLRELNARLATISSHLELVREEEQKRLAHDLHDELGHLLTAGKLDVSFLEQLKRSRSKSDRLALAETLDRLRRTLDGAIASVRKIARQARPGSLDRLGLVATLEALVGDVRDHAGIQARFTPVVDDERFVLSKALEVALYRVAQEALTNVVRHSGATFVDVRFREENGRILLEIQDNGKGFDESRYDPDQSFGLRGMKDRLEMVGGRFSIVGRQGGGTIVTVTANTPVGMPCQTS